MSEEFKEKCSISGKKRFEEDENHPLKMYGNVESPSEETKNKISKTLKEKYKTGERIANHNLLSVDHKKNISTALKEKYENEEHHSKGKPSWNKGKIMEKIECPHCKKMSDKSNSIRWHFDNCKFKINPLL